MMRVFSGHQNSTGGPDLQVIRLGQADSGKRVLVTAGMDGDEYTGIEAAYRLAAVLKTHTIHGEICIIPIVNRAGFRSASSTNPDDGKLPKRVYPGRAQGSATERIIWMIAQRLVKGSALWIDLHAGAIAEELIPCILTYETGRRGVDDLTRTVVRAVSSEHTVRERPGVWNKVQRIAGDGCGFMMFESGWGGSREESDINRHVRWTMRALTVLGFLGHRLRSGASPVSAFRFLAEYSARQAGRWYPDVRAGDPVRKGDVIGEIRPLQGNSAREVRSRVSGKVLWMRRVLPVAVADQLAAVAYGSVRV